MILYLPYFTEYQDKLTKLQKTVYCVLKWYPPANNQPKDSKLKNTFLFDSTLLSVVPIYLTIILQLSPCFDQNLKYITKSLLLTSGPFAYNIAHLPSFLPWGSSYLTPTHNPSLKSVVPPYMTSPLLVGLPLTAISHLQIIMATNHYMSYIGVKLSIFWCNIIQSWFW